MTRVQRTAPIARDVGAVDRKPSALVRGGREIVRGAPLQANRDPRRSAHAGEAVAGAWAGPVSDKPMWSGNNGVVNRSHR